MSLDPLTQQQLSRYLTMLQRQHHWHRVMEQRMREKHVDARTMSFKRVVIRALKDEINHVDALLRFMAGGARSAGARKYAEQPIWPQMGKRTPLPAARMPPDGKA